jgi:hypothetical protein
VFFLNLFRLDLFRTLTRQTEEPIAVITFKYKAAQRRFADRVLWDRLKKESPVYDGDFIRTAEISEATVTFAGGSTIINLEENSLIQLHADDGGLRIDINGGGVSASAADSSLVLVAGDRLVTVEPGGVVKAALDDGDFTLRVMEGALSFTGPGGTGSVRAGETVALGEAGPRTLREAAALFPRPQARFLNPEAGTLAVPFRWNRDNLDPEETTRLEIAEDRAFSRIVFSGESAADTASVELEPGAYFWRVSPAGGEAPSPNTLSFKVLSASAPVLITPAQDYRYQFRTRRPSVRFQWTETEEAVFYVLEAADNPEMTNPALLQEVRGTSFYFPGLEPGTWYWRVRPVFPAAYLGAAGERAPASFSIVQSGDLNAPEPAVPRNRSLVNVAADRGDIYFSWRPEAEARSYRIQISPNRDLANPVLNETVRDNFYVYRTGQNAIRPGQYYWAVSQTDTEGKDSAPSPVYSLTALDGEPFQNLTFPPDGYVSKAVSEAAMPPRFTWETNLPFQMRFQLSEHPDFSSTLIDEAAEGGVFQGRALPQGTWYWRIRGQEPGGAVFETPPRSLVVAAPIAAPPLPEPPPEEPPVEGPPPEEPLVVSVPAPEAAPLAAVEPVVIVPAVEPAIDPAAAGDDAAPPPAAAPVQNLIFPPDGYVSEAVIPPRFTWETDLPFQTRFQLSEHPDFSSTLIDEAAEGGVFQGRALPQGTWYWRIQGQEPGGAVFETPPRSLVVAAPIAAPLLLEPPPEVAAVEGEPVVFSWEAPEGAEYYRFTVYHAEDRDNAVYENNLVEGTRQILSLDSYPEGNYYWTVRGFAPESPQNTPRTGLVAEGVFIIRRPRPVVSPVSPDYPADDALPSGAAASLPEDGTGEAAAAEPAGEGPEGEFVQREETGENQLTPDFEPPAMPKPREILPEIPPEILPAQQPEPVRPGPEPPYRQSLDITVSAGYRPLVPLYGQITELIKTDFFPLGAYSRLGIIPFKRRWGYLGFEFEPSWNYFLAKQEDFRVQAHIPGAAIYGVYQRRFSDRIMAGIRIGGGIYSVLDYYFTFARGKTEPVTILIPAIAAGVSFKWFIKEPLFAEAGLDFTHFFTVDDPSPGYLRPFAGVGWRF